MLGKSPGQSSMLSTFRGVECNGKGKGHSVTAFQEALLVELEDPGEAKSECAKEPFLFALR